MTDEGRNAHMEKEPDHVKRHSYPRVPISLLRQCGESGICIPALIRNQALVICGGGDASYLVALGKSEI
jgi:hypothetical protein